MNNNFKLIAKILKQYEPNSEDRAIAAFAIQTLQNTNRNNPKLLTLKLETVIEEAQSWHQKHQLHG
jgi:hypothetical protein